MKPFVFQLPKIRLILFKLLGILIVPAFKKSGIVFVSILDSPRIGGDSSIGSDKPLPQNYRYKQTSHLILVYQTRLPTFSPVFES